MSRTAVLEREEVVARQVRTPTVLNNPASPVVTRHQALLAERDRLRGVLRARGVNPLEVESEEGDCEYQAGV